MSAVAMLLASSDSSGQGARRRRSVVAVSSGCVSTTGEGAGQADMEVRVEPDRVHAKERRPAVLAVFLHQGEILASDRIRVQDHREGRLGCQHLAEVKSTPAGIEVSMCFGSHHPQAATKPGLRRAPYLVLRLPIALNLRVELQKQLHATLSPRLTDRALVQEEVDAKIGLLDDGLVEDGELADAWTVLAHARGQLAQLLTWKDEILESLHPHRSTTRVQQEEVCRLESFLATGSPETQLPIIPSLLLARRHFVDGPAFSVAGSLRKSSERSDWDRDQEAVDRRRCYRVYSRRSERVQWGWRGRLTSSTSHTSVADAKWLSPWLTLPTASKMSPPRPSFHPFVFTTIYR